MDYLIGLFLIVVGGIIMLAISEERMPFAFIAIIFF